ncbi:hypothetical protein APT58_15175 (plasmid) [Corynebacterium glutamicum]|nr:hypothetical protein APT58_15175 [Corynebacterium glutamicum]
MGAQASPTNRLDKSARRAMFASTLGTLIEWYDYALYGVAAGLIISPLFFPSAQPGTGVLLAFATFAVGFVVRPIGGLIIAHLGDTIGRKPAMILTIVLMGAATTGIGLLPTAEQIGVWAAVLLVVLRAIQGFGAGAELSGALTVAAEFTPDSRQGFFTGIINGVAAGGTAVAQLAFLAVIALPDDALYSWGWRVPFLFSAVLFVLALWIRNKLEESPEYLAAKESTETKKEKGIPLTAVFKESPRKAVLSIILWTGHNANIYVILTFSLGYMTSSIGMPLQSAILVCVVANVLGCLISPLWGMIGDRFGHRKVYALVMVFAALWAMPLFMMMQSGNVKLAFVALLIGSVVTLGGTSGTAGAVTTEIFPAEFRYSGVAAAKEINAAVIAGPTPFIATALIAVAGGGTWLAAIYIIVCCLVTIYALHALDKIMKKEPANVAA